MFSSTIRNFLEWLYWPASLCFIIGELVANKLDVFATPLSNKLADRILRRTVLFLSQLNREFNNFRTWCTKRAINNLRRPRLSRTFLAEPRCLLFFVPTMWSTLTRLPSILIVPKFLLNRSFVHRKPYKVTGTLGTLPDPHPGYAFSLRFFKAHFQPFAFSIPFKTTQICEIKAESYSRIDLARSAKRIKAGKATRQSGPM